MWIVSQNKTISINMNKALNVYRNSECICSEYPFEDAYANLGKYETDERAEEVFRELMERYRSWENLKYGQAEGICEPAYHMPEE